MIYTAFMESSKGTSSNMASLPTTVMEIASSESEAITVLDLSNPSDVAMVTEAGYSVVDLSASIASSETCSSDTVSIVTEDYLSDLDPEIAKAALQAQESGSLIPILKEELKYNIQRKRLVQGKDVLVVENKSTKREREEMSTEEEERRTKRRERNKLAAQKCRSKRKVQANGLEQESADLEEENSDLISQIEQLENEKEMLRNMIRSHNICPRTCNTSLSVCSDDDEDDARGASCYVNIVNIPDGGDLEVETELEIEQVESPFAVHLMGVERLDDDNDEQVVNSDYHTN